MSEPGLEELPLTETSRPVRAASLASLAARLVAEGLGTAILLAAVVGSGIMGERLARGNGALALLVNSLATGAALVALILTLGPISGAHFNPLVTFAMAVRRETAWRDVPGYLAVQGIGALVGVWVSHYIFEVPVLMTSERVRAGSPQWVSEAIATAGLLFIILGCAKSRPQAVPYAVGAYVAAAYWFTSSTSFANPAVTVARAFTNTFAGIRPADVAGFVAAQLVGAALAISLSGWLFPARRPKPS